VQLRGEIDEVEAIVRRDLLTTANDLRAQLTLALREFETFTRSVQQVANEALSSSSNLTGIQIERIAQVAEEAANRIKRAFETNQLDGEGLRNVISRISTAAETISSRLETATLPTEVLEKQLASFGKELESLLERLHQIVDQIAAVPAKIRRRRRRWYWPFG
jgi:uncharacterized coiled-coil DUF342 family protein